MLYVPPKADIPSPPFAQICPSFLAHEHCLKAPQPAHLGCTPTAQLQGHVVPLPAHQDPSLEAVLGLCLTSLSRLSLRDRRVFLLLSASNTALLLLTQSVP
ncbi:mCG1042845 [Mus musculus]|nr:mCG1042845 [Mus musculus]